MRPDVKLGVVISMVVVLVAGSYYFYRGKSERAIPLAEGPEATRERVAVERPARTDVGPESHKQRPAAAHRAQSPRPSVKGDAQLADREAPSPRRRPVRQAQKPTPERSADSRAIGLKNPARTAGADRTSHRAGTESPTIPADSKAVARADETADIPALGAPHPAPVRTRAPTPLAATRSPLEGVTKRPQSADSETAVETHRVQTGDTLSSLALRYYGSTRYTCFLIDRNPQITDPNRLRIGTLVKIAPRPADDERLGPTETRPPQETVARGSRTYRVKAGDSFYSIARDVLGDAKRWPELFELNKQAVGHDATRLQIGQVLALPNR